VLVPTVALAVPWVGVRRQGGGDGDTEDGGGDEGAASGHGALLGVAIRVQETFATGA
jgi:hypothetical protein